MLEFDTTLGEDSRNLLTRSKTLFRSQALHSENNYLLLAIFKPELNLFWKNMSYFRCKNDCLVFHSLLCRTLDCMLIDPPFKVYDQPTRAELSDFFFFQVKAILLEVGIISKSKHLRNCIVLVNLREMWEKAKMMFSKQDTDLHFIFNSKCSISL